MPDLASVVEGAAGVLQRAGACVEPAHSGVRCRGGLWLGVRQLVVVPSSCFCLFCDHALCAADYASFCSVFRVLAVCCCASSCAAAGAVLLDRATSAFARAP